MKKNITINMILKSICVMLFYYFYSYILLLIFDILGIDISDWSGFYKIFILFVIDITLALILWMLYKHDLKKEFIIFKSNWKKLILGNLKYWYLGIILMSVSNYIINIITSNDIASNEQLVRSLVYQYPLYGIFTVCIIAPFTEEIIFRKTFKDIINNKYILMFICGLAFGFIHVIGTYETLTDLLYIIPYGVFGSVFAYMYYKTDTIFTSMSLHLIHNSILLAIYFLSLMLGIGA